MPPKQRRASSPSPSPSADKKKKPASASSSGGGASPLNASQAALLQRWQTVTFVALFCGYFLYVSDAGNPAVAPALIPSALLVGQIGSASLAPICAAPICPAALFFSLTDCACERQTAGRRGVTASQDKLQSELGFTIQDLGKLNSAFTAAYGGSKFLGNILTDFFSARQLFVLGLAAAGVANLVMGVSTSLSVSLTVWALNGGLQGLGCAFCHLSLTLTSRFVHVLSLC